MKSHLSLRSGCGRAAKPAFPQPASSRTPLAARLTLDVGAEHDINGIQHKVSEITSIPFCINVTAGQELEAALKDLADVPTTKTAP